MIRDENDPTGLGLFSRCARNQACKVIKSRPHTANSKKNYTSQLKVHEQKGKNSQNGSWFAKQQSRQHRQLKYKKESTPAVGQYNTLVKQRPKMVWDVIKIYQKKNQQMKKLQETRDKIRQKESTIGLQKSQSKQKHNEKNSSKQNNHAQITKDVKFTQVIDGQSIQNQKSLFNIQSKNRQKTSVSHKSTCMVNMSRMSGRRSGSIQGSKKGRYGLTLDESSNFFDTVELNKSIQKIKPKTTKNFYFKKMLGRKDYDNPIGTANIYECNLGLIRPKKTAQLNFGITQGREDSPSKKQGYVSGYNYYDYNEYVWKGTSAVFRNTKKNLISFDKQR